MKGWEQSPPHRKNLLDPDIFDIGNGIASSTVTGRYYAVQDFGRPKSKEIVFNFTNETDAPVRYTIDSKAQSIDPAYTLTYQVCRPPELTFAESNGKKPEGPTTFHPGSGSHLVIRQAPGGGYVVRTE